MIHWNGRAVLVIGLGASGLSMARHLAAAGARVRVADTRAQPPCEDALRASLPAVECVRGPLCPGLFEGIDCIAVSPGVAVLGPLVDPCVADAIKAGASVVGDIELFAQALAAERSATGYAPKVLAITGTNGKTTVTALTAHLARRAGRHAVVAGNIGPPALDAWAAARAVSRLPEVWVLELSSFQLETTMTLAPDAATVLNVTEDHLDRHGSIAAYARLKERIFAGGGVQVLNRDDARVAAMLRPFKSRNRRDVPPVVYTFGTGEPCTATDFGLIRESRPGGLAWLAQGPLGPHGPQGSAGQAQRLMPQDALRIRGTHNAMNALAAIALNRALGIPLAPMLAALRDYPGEAHRAQPVAEVAGVRYIDDSKGTNVGATLAALTGLGAELAGDRKLVLIAGGDGKGQDFTPMAAVVGAHCRAVILIGRDARVLRDALQGTGVAMLDCSTLELAVREAARCAQPGDAVLLSPACASLDMFQSYVQRADAFVSAVRELGRVEAAVEHPGAANA